MSGTTALDPLAAQWFGIPVKDQPPDHYCLLGLKRFEADWHEWVRLPFKAPFLPSPAPPPQ